ncbi:MAG: GTPase Era, partial [Clostridia bacterium]|nr:GTPase Era [Clostridia bacterium]
MVTKSGFITIVGRPNVGKSTLINRLAGEKIAITSPKPQTTRTNLHAILTEDSYQMIFVDTPGIHAPKNKLGEYMTQSAHGTLSEVDVVVYVCDSTEKTILQSDLKIIDLLRPLKKPVYLVLNKTDAVAKEILLEKIQILSEKMQFTEIIPLSAKTGDGVNLLKELLIKSLPEGPAYFPEDILTDTSVRDLCREIIREKVLLFTTEEVPHGVGIEIVAFNEAKKAGGVTTIDANIYCEKDTHKGILIGK